MGARSINDEHGQASAELVVALGVVVLVTVLIAQLAVAGYALWAAAGGARAGARAAQVGADPVAVARGAVPDLFDPEVSADGGAISVAVRAPSLVPGLAPLRLEAASALDPAGAAGR